MSSGAAPAVKFGLAELEVFAEQFATRHLDEYTTAIEISGRSPQPKEVNDALWGTIGLTRAEVVLLDAPLLQRLRYIRQLGVVHWVYPGAIHTRFEHSLGVLNQVRHITTALNNVAASTPSERPLIDADHVQLLRLCALLHDIGHPAFSHVSEMATETVPAIAPLAKEFSTNVKVETRQLSEMFAYYVVRSKAMRRLIQLMLDRSWLTFRFAEDRQANLDATIEKISNAIVGKQIDNKLPLLHELISGPFDADKLDYFVRDAKLAGTPSVLDISRLVQKLTVRSFVAEDLPSDLSRNVAKQDRYWLFGVKWSGVAVLDELHLARVLLYSKIYRHPKVVAIEQMLRAVISTLAKFVDASCIVEFLYTHPDDAMVWMTESTLAVALKIDTKSLSAENQQRLVSAAQTLKDLRERRLWHRAVQIHSRYPSDPLEKAPQQKHGLIEFLEEVEHPQHRQTFLSALLNEVKRIHDLLNPQQPLDRGFLDSQVMLHTLGATPGGTQIARAYLLPSSGKPTPYREYMVNRTAWADSYLTDQPRGYILSSPQLADYVYIAFEKLIRTQFQVRLPASALEAGKRDPARIEALKRSLGKSAFYRDVPVDIRPIPERLGRADVVGIVAKFQNLRKAYLSPTGTFNNGTEANGPEEHTLMWLRQFDDDAHVECALRLLSKFKMLTRDDTVNAVRTFIDSNPDFKGASVVPLGNAKDSGALHAYFTADLLGTHVGRCASLEDAKRDAPKAPVIFIDDFVASGGQTRDILGAWFDNQDLRMPLNEDRSMFDNGLQTFLREVKVAFVIVAAWDDGIGVLKEALSKVKLDATVYRHLTEKDLPFVDSALADLERPIVESFLARCSEIGRSVLTSAASSEGKIPDAAKLEQRLLGYGNRGMLLASPFNVPSQTLTAIWARGTVNGVDWQPLLNRRKKK